MSVLVIVKLKANRDAFAKIIAERGEEMAAISARGKAAGAIHHRFGLGDDGTVVVLDEWDSAEHFSKFFDNPEIAQLMADGMIEGPPEVTIVDAVASADQF